MRIDRACGYKKGVTDVLAENDIEHGVFSMIEHGVE